MRSIFRIVKQYTAKNEHQKPVKPHAKTATLRKRVFLYVDRPTHFKTIA